MINKKWIFHWKDMSLWNIKDRGYQTSGHTDVHSSGRSEFAKFTVLLNDNNWIAKSTIIGLQAVFYFYFFHFSWASGLISTFPFCISIKPPCPKGIGWVNSILITVKNNFYYFISVFFWLWVFLPQVPPTWRNSPL